MEYPHYAVQGFVAITYYALKFYFKEEPSGPNMVFAFRIVAMILLICSLLDIISEDRKCIFQPSPIGLSLERVGYDGEDTTQVSPCVWMGSYH